MAGDSQTTIEIGQADQNSVSLSSQQFWLDAAAGEFQIQVQANVVYQVKIEADWIELASPENESLLTFRAKVNVGDTRTGTIVVSGGGVSAKAEVTQFAPSEITVSPMRSSNLILCGTILRGTAKYRGRRRFEWKRFRVVVWR